MTLPLSIAKKLLQLSNGDPLPASRFPKIWRSYLSEEGILAEELLGRTKAKLHLKSSRALFNFLTNQYGIQNLERYVERLENGDLSGTEAQEVASDTKLRTRSPLPGFLATSYFRIQASLKGQSFTIHPPRGSFVFIEDTGTFNIPDHVTVVGIENPENFRNLGEFHSWFAPHNPLYVCRYPQSRALVDWLTTIPNTYVHFGDLDLAGVAIYEWEFRQRLGERASFYVPGNALEVLQQFGSRSLYDKQYDRYRNLSSSDPKAQQLIDQIHQARKGLEQEFFIHWGAHKSI